MRFFHHIYRQADIFCLCHHTHARTYIRTHETQFSLRSAHIKNIGGITNKFLVCFFFSPFPKKRVSHSHLVKYMYYQSRNSLPSFASALVAFFNLFLHCTLSKATTSTIKVRTTRVYFSQPRGKGVLSSSRLVLVHKDTQVSDGQVHPVCPANFRSHVRHTNTRI